MDSITSFVLLCTVCLVGIAHGQRIAVIGNIPFAYRPTSSPVVAAKATYAEYLQSYINQLQQLRPAQTHSITYQLPTVQSMVSQPAVYFQQPAVTAFQQPAVYQQPSAGFPQQSSFYGNAQQSLQQGYQQSSQQQMYEPLMMPAPAYQPQPVYQPPQQPVTTYQQQPALQAIGYQPQQQINSGYVPPPAPPVYQPPPPPPPPPPRVYQPPPPPRQQPSYPPRPQNRPPAMMRGRSYDKKPMMRSSYGPPKKMMKKKRKKMMKRYADDHDYDDDHEDRKYDDERDDESRYGDDHEMGYGRPKKQKKKKIERIYVPVRVQKKKKKMKIVSIMPGFYVAGGTQIFGKFKSLKQCEKACSATPSCFAGDFNPWLNKCYLHTNFTACGSVRAHKKLTHFKKVPCQVPEAPEGRITLGAQLFRGIEQKGIKSLSDCIKKCASAGTGIPVSVVNIGDQLCFGIDYDFGSHKCYFHVDNSNFRICPNNGMTPLTPRDLVPNPAVINIILCPGP